MSHREDRTRLRLAPIRPARPNPSSPAFREEVRTAEDRTSMTDEADTSRRTAE